MMESSAIVGESSIDSDGSRAAPMGHAASLAPTPDEVLGFEFVGGGIMSSISFPLYCFNTPTLKCALAHDDTISKE